MLEALRLWLMTIFKVSTSAYFKNQVGGRQVEVPGSAFDKDGVAGGGAAELQVQ